jgi:hypothetical protein
LKANKDFKTLTKEQEDKARAELEESGLDHLITFTLENFAYRYLETDCTRNIKAVFNGSNQYSVSSIEEDPMSALSISDPKSKKGVISLVKRFSKTKGVGLRVRYQLLCDTSDIGRSGTGLIKCSASINWNLDEDFRSDPELESIKTASIEFDDPLILRNKLALLLEDVCQIF